MLLELPPFFLFLFITLSGVVGATLPAPNYPGQKYLLSKKFPDGTIRKVGVYDHPVTMEQVLSEHGSAYYILRSTKARFQTVWKGLIGAPKQSDLPQAPTPMEVVSLERKTDHIIGGLVVLGVGTALGFGLTGLSLTSQGQRLNRAEAILQTYATANSVPLPFCGTCNKQLFGPFNSFCGHCGTRLLWPEKFQLAQQSEQVCGNCCSSVRPGQLFCTECSKPLFAFTPQSTKDLRWRLP